MDCPTQHSSTYLTLKNDLFCNYDSSALPTHKNENTTAVYVRLVLQCLQFVEFEDTVRLHTWMEINWSDERLSWDPVAYSNLYHIMLDRDILWFPDIMLYSASHMDRSSPITGNVSCEVQHTGSVTCTAVVALSGRCHVDARLWPHDVHNCSLLVGSRQHAGSDVDIRLHYKPVQLYRYQPNMEWHLAEMNVTRHVRSFGHDIYPWLEYYVVLERYSTGMAAIVEVPALVLVMLTLLSFSVEPECLERVAICTSNVAGHVIYLLYMVYLVPSNADKLPLALEFYIDSLVLATLTTIVSVVTYALTTRTHVPPKYVSSCMDSVAKSFIGKFLIPQEFTHKENITEEQEQEIHEEQLNRENKIPLEWRILAGLINRLVFIIYILIILILIHRIFV